MKNIRLFFYLFIFFHQLTQAQTWKTYPYTPTGSLISFSADEGRHPNEPVEWWYTMGHLTGDTTGKHYTFMLAYFSYPFGNYDGFRILNISDEDQQIFDSEMNLLNYDILATDKLDIQAQILGGGTDIWKNLYDNAGILPFQYEIYAQSGTVTLDLDFDTVKRPLILGDDGYLLQASNNYTYYYSQTGIDVTGSITYAGTTETVTGSAWIDRQYGTLNPSEGTQYEWFSLQLSNGMDFNLWNIFEDNQIPDDDRYKILASYVDENTQYTISDFNLERLSYHYTPDGVNCYAQSWRLTSPVNDVDVVFQVTNPNSEVQLPFRFYEGAIVASGTINGVPVTGQGFAELLHTYEVPDISIEAYSAWNSTIPFVWQLNNPDDGNPLTYNLAYSTDNQNTFSPLVNGVQDLNYDWQNPPLSDGDVFWLKVTGQSVDGTISGSAVQEFTYDSTASLSGNQAFFEVKIYPNPVSGKFWIEASDMNRIEIFDMQGKLVLSRKTDGIDKLSLDKNQLKGNYLIKVYTEQGIYTQKLIFY